MAERSAQSDRPNANAQKKAYLIFLNKHQISWVIATSLCQRSGRYYPDTSRNVSKEKAVHSQMKKKRPQKIARVQRYGLGQMKERDKQEKKTMIMQQWDVGRGSRRSKRSTSFWHHRRRPPLRLSRRQSGDIVRLNECTL